MPEIAIGNKIKRKDEILAIKLSHFVIQWRKVVRLSETRIREYFCYGECNKKKEKTTNKINSFKYLLD